VIIIQPAPPIVEEIKIQVPPEEEEKKIPKIEHKLPLE